MWQKEKSLPLLLAMARMSGVTIAQDDRAYRQLCDCAASYKQRYAGSSISEVPGVEWSRKLFHAMNQDPTKRRPSSEALLNRALKDKPLYNINTLVDLGNWCSLDFLLPICVYDADAVQDQVRVRTGRNGETYLGHNDQIMNMEGRFIIADEEGPFGSPISDSQRTAVTTASRNAYLVIFAPVEYAGYKLQQQMSIFVERTKTLCGGKVEEQYMI
jgi:DNA/RNA-binding domain of Phe-tRNA-synthetase-like protein